MNRASGQIQMLNKRKEPLQLFSFAPADILSQLQGHCGEDIVKSAAIVEKITFLEIFQEVTAFFSFS